MSALFGFLAFCCFIVLISGLIWPSLNSKNPTRKAVLIKFGSITGIMIAISIFSSGVLTENPGGNTPSTYKITQQAEQQKLDNAAEEYVKIATEKGLVVKIVPELNQAFVEPSIWNALDFETKERTAGLFARYCGMKNGMDSRLISIKDKYSGKELAALGLFGFKVN